MRRTKRRIRGWEGTEIENQDPGKQKEKERHVACYHLFIQPRCRLVLQEPQKTGTVSLHPPSPPVCVFALECRRHTKRTLYVHSLSFLEGTPFLSVTYLRHSSSIRFLFSFPLLSRTRSTYPHLYPLVFLPLCVAKPSFKLVSPVPPSETLCILRPLHFSRRFLHPPPRYRLLSARKSQGTRSIHKYFLGKFFGRGDSV